MIILCLLIIFLLLVSSQISKDEAKNFLEMRVRNDFDLKLQEVLLRNSIEKNKGNKNVKIPNHRFGKELLKNLGVIK